MNPAIFCGAFTSSPLRLRSAGQLVAGFFDGALDGRRLDLVVAVDGYLPGGEVDVDRGDAGDVADLITHRGRAMPAGHACNGDTSRVHLSPSMIRPCRNVLVQYYTPLGYGQGRGELPATDASITRREFIGRRDEFARLRRAVQEGDLVMLVEDDRRWVAG